MAPRLVTMSWEMSNIELVVAGGCPIFVVPLSSAMPYFHNL